MIVLINKGSVLRNLEMVLMGQTHIFIICVVVVVLAPKVSNKHFIFIIVPWYYPIIW